MVLPSSFSSSRLVRLLSAWTHQEVGPAEHDLAQRLSPWLGVFDAVNLHAAHQTIKASGQEPGVAPTEDSARALVQALERLHQTLSQAIHERTSPAPAPKPARLSRFQSAHSPLAEEPELSWPVFKQRYQALQHLMDTRVNALRGQVRQALFGATPALRQLATLDVALGATLDARAEKLLPKVPSLLEKRFEQLRQAQASATESPPEGADPVSALLAAPAPPWQAGFRQDMQDVLLAELEVRLQPLAGLIEAFKNEVKSSP